MNELTIRDDEVSQVLDDGTPLTHALLSDSDRVVLGSNIRVFDSAEIQAYSE